LPSADRQVYLCLPIRVAQEMTCWCARHGVAVVTALVLVIDAGLERVQAQSLAWRPLSRDVAV